MTNLPNSILLQISDCYDGNESTDGFSSDGLCHKCIEFRVNMSKLLTDNVTRENMFEELNDYTLWQIVEMCQFYMDKHDDTLLDCQNKTTPPNREMDKTGGTSAVTFCEKDDGTPIIIKKIDCLNVRKIGRANMEVAALRLLEQFLMKTNRLGDLWRFPQIVQYILYKNQNSTEIIMRRAVGPTLAEFVKMETTGLPTASELKTFCKILASSLYYIHSAEISHGDLNPNNIIMEGGMWERPVIIDFGLAEIHSNKENAMSKDSSGTRAFMPPECFDDEEYCKYSSDVWAFGVVMYYAATGGKLPWKLKPVSSKFQFPYEIDTDSIDDTALESLLMSGSSSNVITPMSIEAPTPNFRQCPYASSIIPYTEIDGFMSFITKILVGNRKRRPTAMVLRTSRFMRNVSNSAFGLSINSPTCPQLMIPSKFAEYSLLDSKTTPKELSRSTED